ncbi:hypothetical protein L1887_56416 [Cichorium endivia]|nr:hypothetical protein L1887_56416 [Cichorium endivia]
MSAYDDDYEPRPRRHRDPSPRPILTSASLLRPAGPIPAAPDAPPAASTSANSLPPPPLGSAIKREGSRNRKAHLKPEFPDEASFLNARSHDLEGKNRANDRRFREKRDGYEDDEGERHRRAMAPGRRPRYDDEDDLPPPPRGSRRRDRDPPADMYGRPPPRDDPYDDRERRRPPPPPPRRLTTTKTACRRAARAPETASSTARSLSSRGAAIRTAVPRRADAMTTAAAAISTTIPRTSQTTAPAAGAARSRRGVGATTATTMITTSPGAGVTMVAAGTGADAGTLMTNTTTAAATATGRRRRSRSASTTWARGWRRARTRMTRPGVGTAGIKGSKRACGGLGCVFPAYIWSAEVSPIHLEVPSQLSAIYAYRRPPRGPALEGSCVRELPGARRSKHASRRGRVRRIAIDSHRSLPAASSHMYALEDVPPVSRHTASSTLLSGGARHPPETPTDHDSNATFQPTPNPAMSSYTYEAHEDEPSKPCKCCRLASGLDLPVPNSLENEQIRPLAQAFSHSIFADWTRLNAILKRFEALIQKRWLKRSAKQRRETLLAVQPCIPLVHRPDFEGFRNFNNRRLARERICSSHAHLTPYINLEDLMQGHNLLLFLNSRGRHLPVLFASTEADKAHLGYGWITQPERDGYAMAFYGKQTPKQYGTVTKVAFLPRRIGAVQSYTPIYGLLILEIQQSIYGFLLRCAQAVLHDLNPADYVLAPHKQEPPPPKDSTGSWASISKHTIEAYYRTPHETSLDRMKLLVDSRRLSAEDHVSLLREDPGYFLENLKTGTSISAYRQPPR